MLIEQNKTVIAIAGELVSVTSETTRMEAADPVRRDEPLPLRYMAMEPRKAAPAAAPPLPPEGRDEPTAKAVSNRNLLTWQHAQRFFADEMFVMRSEAMADKFVKSWHKYLRV